METRNDIWGCDQLSFSLGSSESGISHGTDHYSSPRTSFSHEAFKLTKYRGYCLGDRAFCLIDIDKMMMSEVDELNLYYETIRSDWYVASSH